MIGDQVRVLLYDADGSDEERELGDVVVSELTDARLLWVDVDPDEATDVELVTRALALDSQALGALVDATDTPSLVLHRDYFQLELVAVDNDADAPRAVRLSCLAGRNWVLTSHPAPLAFLDRYDSRFRGESDVGRLGSAIFVATVLGELLRAYDEEIRKIVNAIDRVDQLVFRDRIEETTMLRELVTINQRIVRLRRWLAPHRDVFERLTQPDFTQLVAEDLREGTFTPIVARLDRTLDSLDTARRMLATSLDLYATLVAHGTNKVIKLLTLVSVTLLPPTLLAGILGMNALPGSLKTQNAFAIAMVTMLTLITTTLLVARRRAWI